MFMMFVEPFPKCKNIFIPEHTTELKPEASRVDVVLQNLSGRDIILEPHTEVAMVLAANKFPSILTPDVLEKNVQDDEDDEDDESLQCKSAQAELPKCEKRQAEIDLEEIL